MNNDCTVNDTESMPGEQQPRTLLEWLKSANQSEIARMGERVVDPRDQARIIEA